MSTRERVAKLFRQNRGKSISLLRLLKVAPAQYSKRISDLRREGMDIRCALTRTKAGTRSAYTYLGER